MVWLLYRVLRTNIYMALYIKMLICSPFGEAGHFWWEPTFFMNEMVLYTLSGLTFLHARRHGSRYLYLWWTCMLHGFTVELVSYWTEEIDNFWHAQSTFMFFGQREPLQIIVRICSHRI